MRWWIVLPCAVAAASCASRRASQAELDAYRELRGSLAAAETTFTGMRGRYAAYHVTLRSTSGLHATGRLLRPVGRAGSFPAVLLNDGRELNSQAVEYLPPEFGDVVVLSLDYPEALPYEISVSALLCRSGALKRAARQIPALFSLGASYLTARGDVDPSRVALAATSFAVPFATIAAALDTTFRNVALIYGAGDFGTVMAANLTLRPRFIRGAVASIAARPFAEFEPTRFVARIAPRPIIMVNGIDDPQMPRSAVQALFDAAQAPKDIVWLRTGHLMPTDSVLIRALVDTSLARLPVLRREAPGPR